MSYVLLSFFIVVVVFPVFVQFGITNAGVIDGFEFLDKGSFDRLHIAEAEGGIAQETVGDLRVDDAVDELRDTFVGVFFEASRSGFDGIGHHEYSRFLREWVGTGVGEFRFVYGLVGVFVTERVIKEFGFPVPVVRGDKVFDSLGQS